ncbi:hypothetical protein PM10SUCC1_37390 [Propionigenium maris DSM 9537]|uniref:Shikimate dehydrogenase (NADP(+)) n=1 Tax=Propionigenium maris DSM 9537 TaxID=1123000 RepID=A0A9W6GPS9_9FUSO|nr:shikimate dehydrogenase [Propionigenium maris]GLI58225.1 hypothetical protein PM10SUCC1_37390 [Propionigenium maris DSM 9537]
MRKFILIGEKLGHSYSPEIHRASMRKMGVQGDYSLLEVSSQEIPGVIEDIRGGKISGMNVTIPYKVEVMNYLDLITPEAKEIGAVNTVALEDGKLVGYNTDYWGFRYTLEKNEVDIEGKRCVILGGGGSARAVIKALQDMGGIVYLVSRSPERIRESFSNFKGLSIISYTELEELQGELIVNTTPVGMYPKTDACVVDAQIIQNFSRAVDLIYNPQETLFLSRAKEGENGLYMLVGQAVKAQEIWWKRSLDTFEDIYAHIEGIVYKK